MSKMAFKRFHPLAKTPTRSYETSAGLDLYSCETAVIRPQSLGCIHTGIGIKLPKNTYGRIAERSSVALQHRITILGSVIDEGYNGQLKVIMFNLSKTRPYRIYLNTKIAQLIVEPCYYPTLYEVKELEATDRNDNGFGSSGK